MAFGWGGMMDAMANANIDRGAEGGSAAAAASGYGNQGRAEQTGPGDYWNMGKRLSRKDWLIQYRGADRPWEYMNRDEFDAYNEYSNTFNMSRHYGKDTTERPPPEAAPDAPEAEREIGTTPGFERVQKFLRQQSATGRTITPEMIRGAWQGYWGAWSDKESERARVGLQKESLDLSKERFAYEKEMGWKRFGMDEERMEREDKAAAAAGGCWLCGWGASGWYGRWHGGRYDRREQVIDS